MIVNRRKWAVLSGALLTVLPSAAFAQSRWYRGNTHTHTINTDGDSSPDIVVRWYKEHGYQFIVISDHDSLTPTAGLNAVFSAPEKFLVIPGEEVTDRFEGAPVHLIAVGLREAVTPLGGTGITDTIERDAAAIRAAGGLPHINHPNWGWALNAEQIAAAKSIKHFEVFNGHHAVNIHGGGGSPSTEEIWDSVLSTGHLLYGLATDDAHHFQGEPGPLKDNPGRGWIMVRATELSPAALAAALERGDFYSSTGITLKSYEVSSSNIRIELPAETGRNATRYRTFFIGKNGAILKRDESLAPSYEINGKELYVRARIESSNGALAWTQPVFPKK